MKKLALLTMVTTLTLTLGCAKQHAPIEGCYLTNDKIMSFVSDESVIKSSYIEISKVGDSFFAQGTIWGDNFHICSIGSVTEGSDGPLPMNYVENKLTFSEDDPEYDINCKLALSFSNDKLIISDTNYHCAEYIFSCGARVELDTIELPKVKQACPTPNDNRFE